MDDYKSRKFILACFAALSATALVYLGKIDQGIYATIMGAVFTVYVAGNVSQKAVLK